MRSPGGIARRALIAGLGISLAWMGGPADGQTTAELRQRWEEAVAAYRRHWITDRAQGFWADFDLLQTGWRRPALNSAEEAVLLDRCTAGGSEAAKRRQALL